MKNHSQGVRMTLLAHALALAFAGPVHAQSNATGSIFGQVANAGGSVVVLENIATGARRTISVDASGRYNASSMPPGLYKVMLVRNGVVERVLEVEALIGQGVEASFEVIQAVTVSSRRPTIDVSNTNNGAVFTARQLDALPISQSLSGIIQLAPGTARGNTRVGGDSFGGAGVTENAYFINGFPVTNVYRQIGSTTLPFFAIAQAQILQGGYSAEFGRSTGGVVNITTKSGTNNWEAGAVLQYTPDWLRAKPDNTDYPDTGHNPKTDGKLLTYRHGNNATDVFGSAYVGGPLIKDKLFMFANIEQDRFSTGYISKDSDSLNKTNGWTEREARTPRYLLKLDYNISDNHRLEFTQIHDENKKTQQNYGFDYATLQRNEVRAGGTTGDGAKTNDSILKYTGFLTDNLTVTALAGRFKSTYPQSREGYVPGVYQIIAPMNAQVPGLSYTNPQTIGGTIQVPNAEDKQSTLRLDVEYKLGDHALRAGIDRNNVSSINGSELAGGGSWTYFHGDPSKTVPGGNTPASGGGYGLQGYYVNEYHQSDSASPKTDQSAQYIQDRWQVTDTVLLDLGLRNEQFTNKNSFGQAYAAQRHMLAPRIGASWDVRGDSTLKAFANLGRYHLQIPTSVALRLAGNPVHIDHYFTYTGVDPKTGVPTGLTEISPRVSGGNEWGNAKDPRQVASSNLGATYQDEIALGFEAALTPEYTVGSKVTYRTLRNTIEDWCDSRPLRAWGKRNNVDTSKYDMPCLLINPGRDNTLTLDLAGDGKLVSIPLTAEEIGLPKVSRVYTALDFFIEHPMRNGWYGKLYYTLSRTRGNMEGQVMSDIGQADIAATTSFDFPELMDHASGPLPNNHTHVLKAFGYYQLGQEWTVGGNINIVTGAPKSCIGNLPTALNQDGKNPAANYGAAVFYCDDKPAPRGSAGRMPTDFRIALNATYMPRMFKGLALKADVFNLLNRQTTLATQPVYNAGANTVSPYYGQVLGRAPERQVRFAAQYNHKF
ncbi:MULTISPECIES: TonB-dependent receptor [unclassified Duganella]|uniref:TonB-dependent receptor n=1 Tax=unclassified Duganella TaxID=2636909 RepID=UPI0006F3CC06|nr:MULTISPECIES: TonB-dependent receptor [unclassified Duganella]KQV46675.1 TetR family transcriptional regulator [Duganella sp. Root336D2]KRC00908.1 TetR family transcriptional regulator [Duganella sp. Root198D2]